MLAQGEMIFLASEFLPYSLRWLPHPYRIIKASRGDVFSRRRPDCSYYWFLVLSIFADALSCPGIPDLHGRIIASRGDIPAIWRPCYGINLAGRVAIAIPKCADSASCLHIPNAYRLIIASG